MDISVRHRHYNCDLVAFVHRGNAQLQHGYLFHVDFQHCLRDVSVTEPEHLYGWEAQTTLYT